jgi:hypothetical protein
MKGMTPQRQQHPLSSPRHRQLGERAIYFVNEQRTTSYPFYLPRYPRPQKGIDRDLMPLW